MLELHSMKAAEKKSLVGVQKIGDKNPENGQQRIRKRGGKN